MHGNLPAEELAATAVTLGNGDEILASESDDWFVFAAWTILGTKDAGSQLNLITGWPLSSCYAFTAKDPKKRRRPSEEFLRLLFRTEQGAPFHAAFMSGCSASWWLDLQAAEDRARKVEARLAEITEIACRK